MFYIYKFINKYGEIIYVGKTNNIENRMIAHFTRGHLPKQCYNDIKKIQYCLLKNKIDMDILELYLIATIKPKYNTFHVDSGYPTFNLNNTFNWIDFNIQQINLDNKNQKGQINTRSKYIEKKIDPNGYLILTDTRIDSKDIVEPLTKKGIEYFVVDNEIYPLLGNIYFIEHRFNKIDLIRNFGVSKKDFIRFKRMAYKNSSLESVQLVHIEAFKKIANLSDTKYRSHKKVYEEVREKLKGW